MTRSKGRRHRKTALGHSRSRMWLLTGGGIVVVAVTAGAGLIAMLLVGGDIPRSVASVIAPHDRAAITWQAVVTDDAVNVRSAASTDSDVIGSMMAHQRVTVTGVPVGDFLPVAIDGKRGWMAADYLRRDAVPTGSAPVASIPGPVANGGDAVVPQPTELPSLPLTAPTADLPVVAPQPTDVPLLPVVGDTSPPDDAEPAVPEPSPSSAVPTVTLAAVDAGAVEDVPANVTADERWIDVNRSTATITLYVGEQPQRSFHGKIGRDPSVDGFYSTAVGTFHVYSMQRGLSGTPFVDDVYLSDWVGFDPVRKNGFHSPVREADGSERVTQNPTTMGCVRLTAGDAVSLFEFAALGMRVEIHD